GRRQYRQHLQPRSRGDLRRRDAGRREAVRAAPQRSEAPGLQTRRRRLPHRARRAHRNGGRVWCRRRIRPAQTGSGVKRLGVIGSMVWDTIYGRDPAQPAVEEWGGISYSLAALDATLRDDWQIVPLIKVGRDLAPRAAEFLGTLHHVAPGARFVEVPAANNRVTLRYYQRERRCEQMSGGVPPWTWPELGPQVTDLDALYVNFISGYEMDLETAQLLRRGFPRFLYADLHSLFLGKEPDGTRVPRPLPDAPAWFGCFDTVQLNSDEMEQLGPDPLAVAAGALARGCHTLVVTLGPRGAAYFTGDPVRTALIPAEGTPLPDGDPTGCGDVLGATVAASLIAGAGLEAALRLGTRMGARNVSHRGASGPRAGFFREAAELFEIHGKVPRVKAAEESDVLLPVTPVRAAEDVHAVVSNIQQRASAILASELGLDPKATMGFAMALSEACQNIVEHAGTGGWVAVQAYHWRRKLARRVVVIAVADAGVGFRHSLE